MIVALVIVAMFRDLTLYFNVCLNPARGRLIYYMRHSARNHISDVGSTDENHSCKKCEARKRRYHNVDIYLLLRNQEIVICLGGACSGVVLGKVIVSTPLSMDALISSS
jgi:hypothetical protein